MKTVFRRAAVLFALAVAACGGSDKATAPNTSSISGTYTLTILGGVALPASITLEGTLVGVHGSTIALSTDNTYTRTIVVETTAGTATITDEGTIAVSGNKLTFTSSGAGGVLVGTLAGSAFTFNDSGYLWTYVK